MFRKTRLPVLAPVVAASFAAIPAGTASTDAQLTAGPPADDDHRQATAGARSDMEVAR